jgi:hypothetical protein
MQQREITTTIREIQRKLLDGSEISAADVEQIAAAATASERIEHRAMYAEAKRVHRDGPAKPPEPPIDKPVTAEDVKAAYEKAKKTGRIEDRVTYAALKTRIDKNE